MRKGLAIAGVSLVAWIALLMWVHRGLESSASADEGSGAPIIYNIENGATTPQLTPIVYHRNVVVRRRYATQPRTVIRKRKFSHSAAIVGGSAAGGAAIGAAAGGGKGAAIGALAGGGAGLIYDRATHKKKVREQ